METTSNSKLKTLKQWQNDYSDTIRFHLTTRGTLSLDAAKKVMEIVVGSDSTVLQMSIHKNAVRLYASKEAFKQGITSATAIISNNVL